MEEDWKVDTDDFKVVCQKCGKMGSIAFDKPYPGFVLSEGYDDDLSFEYYLCVQCFGEIHGPEDRDN